MSSIIKLLLNGMPVRYLCEGEMSDIHIEITEWYDDLRRKGMKYGDFQLTNPTTSYAKLFKDEFDKFVDFMSKYGLDAKGFVDSTIEKSPNITFLQMLLMLQEKFL